MPETGAVTPVFFHQFYGCFRLALAYKFLLNPANWGVHLPHWRILMKTVEQPSPRLIPVTEWNKYHPYPPIGGLRHLIFYGKTNGFAKVVRRVGRRVLIDEAAFFAWVVAQNGGRS